MFCCFFLRSGTCYIDGVTLMMGWGGGWGGMLTFTCYVDDVTLMMWWGRGWGGMLTFMYMLR